MRLECQWLRYYYSFKLDSLGLISELEINEFSTPKLSNEEEYTIQFKRVFSKPPVVLVSSVTGLVIGNGSIGLVVSNITTKNFTIHSSYEEATYINVGYMAALTS